MACIWDTQVSIQWYYLSTMLITTRFYLLIINITNVNVEGMWIKYICAVLYAYVYTYLIELWYERHLRENVCIEHRFKE